MWQKEIQTRPPDDYFTISKVSPRQLAIVCLSSKEEPFLLCGCRRPVLPGTQVDA